MYVKFHLFFHFLFKKWTQSYARKKTTSRCFLQIEKIKYNEKNNEKLFKFFFCCINFFNL